MASRTLREALTKTEEKVIALRRILMDVLQYDANGRDMLEDIAAGYEMHDGQPMDNSVLLSELSNILAPR